MEVKYCSNPDGHSPKDCPDYPQGDAAILYKWDLAALKTEMENMDIEIDEEELEEKVHDGSLMELM